MKAFTLLKVLMAWMMCLTLVVATQVAVPPVTTPVTDMTSTLRAEQRSTLERSLLDFEAKKGSQIGLLIVSSTAPDTVERYAPRVVERWKPGREKVDDGALLIVAKDDRAMRIDVGYGLLAALAAVLELLLILFGGAINGLCGRHDSGRLGGQLAGMRGWGDRFGGQGGQFGDSGASERW